MLIVNHISRYANGSLVGSWNIKLTHDNEDPSRAHCSLLIVQLDLLFVQRPCVPKLVNIGFMGTLICDKCLQLFCTLVGPYKSVLFITRTSNRTRLYCCYSCSIIVYVTVT